MKRPMFLCALVLAVFSGCGEAPSEGSSQSSAAAVAASERNRPAIPFPSDPDTEITVSVAKVDTAGTVTIVNTIRTTKGDQWKRMTQPAETEKTVDLGQVAETKSAIAQETCSPYSLFWLNDQANSTGNYLCFNFGGNPSNLFDLTTVPFVMKSLYSTIDDAIFDGSLQRQHTYCGGGPNGFDYIANWTGPQIRYVQTPDNKSGRCHF